MPRYLPVSSEGSSEEKGQRLRRMPPLCFYVDGHSHECPPPSPTPPDALHACVSEALGVLDLFGVHM